MADIKTNARAVPLPSPVGTDTQTRSDDASANARALEFPRKGDDGRMFEAGGVELQLPLSAADVREDARHFLSSFARLAVANDTFKPMCNELRTENPSWTELRIARYAQALIADGIAQCKREEVDNAHGGLDVYLPRVCALVEASLMARRDALRFVGASDSPDIPLASDAQGISRELDFNFARYLALSLPAWLVNDDVTAETDTRFASGEAKDRNVVLARVLADRVVTICSGDGGMAQNDGTNMNPEDRSFVLGFCELLRGRLMEGVEFSQRVAFHLGSIPGESRERAHRGCAIALAREVLIGMKPSVGNPWKPQA